MTAGRSSVNLKSFCSECRSPSGWALESHSTGNSFQSDGDSLGLSFPTSFSSFASLSLELKSAQLFAGASSHDNQWTGDHHAPRVALNATEGTSGSTTAATCSRPLWAPPTGTFLEPSPSASGDLLEWRLQVIKQQKAVSTAHCLSFVEQLERHIMMVSWASGNGRNLHLQPELKTGRSTGRRNGGGIMLRASASAKDVARHHEAVAVAGMMEVVISVVSTTASGGHWRGHANMPAVARCLASTPT